MSVAFEEFTNGDLPPDMPDAEDITMVANEHLELITRTLIARYGLCDSRMLGIVIATMTGFFLKELPAHRERYAEAFIKSILTSFVDSIAPKPPTTES